MPSPIPRWKIFFLAWGVFFITKGLFYVGPLDPRIDYVFALCAGFLYWVYRTNNPTNLRKDAIIIISTIVLTFIVLYFVFSAGGTNLSS